jgi:phosphoribosyl-ATP pyrophosphohydrolase
MAPAASVFHDLMRTVQDRRDLPSERSYTRTLLDGGVTTIGTKILEEAAELVDAASPGCDYDKTRVVHEAADLIYHLFVLLASQSIELTDVEAELHRRFGMSGLDEKASRTVCSASIRIAR